MIKICLFAVICTAVVFGAPQAPVKQYPLRIQPELDVVDVDSYLKNDRLFNLQIKCLVDEGPCDIVGRWLKPRIARALLGECPVCTPVQKVKIDRVIEDLQTNRPETYRALFVRFIEKAGIKVDDDKKAAPDSLPSDTPDEHPGDEDVKSAIKAEQIPTEAPAGEVSSVAP